MKTLHIAGVALMIPKPAQWGTVGKPLPVGCGTVPFLLYYCDKQYQVLSRALISLVYWNGPVIPLWHLIQNVDECQIEALVYVTSCLCANWKVNLLHSSDLYPLVPNQPMYIAYQCRKCVSNSIIRTHDVSWS